MKLKSLMATSITNSVSFSVFKKLIKRNLPWKNLSNFLRAVLEKFAVNIYRRTLRFRTIFGNLKPFKYDEKWFYFTLKALFVHNIFKFLSWLFGHDKNGLIRKIVRRYNPVNKQLQYVYFPISQELKAISQWSLVMRNVFLEKSYTICGGELFPGSFLKNQNWAYLWVNSLKIFIQFVFILC